MHTLVWIIVAVALVIAFKAGIKRDTSNNVFGGVCSGIANRTGYALSVVRVLTFIFCAITGGVGTLAYIVLWIGLPKN
jgi:phage shock protein PspC (stress-responsive transcriptional regulator)